MIVETNKVMILYLGEKTGRKKFLNFLCMLGLLTVRIFTRCLGFGLS